MGAHPAALHSSSAWTMLPFPHISLWDASGGGAGLQCQQQSTPRHPSCECCRLRGQGCVWSPNCDGDTLAQVIQVVPPECPPCLPCPHSPAVPPLPSLCPRAKSIVQNYVFKYLGFHQLCKLSPSIKAAVWVLCWRAGLCHASGSLCSCQPWPQGMQPGNGTWWAGASLLAQGPRPPLPRRSWKLRPLRPRCGKSRGRGRCCEGNRLGWVLFGVGVGSAACRGKQDEEQRW